MKRKGIAICCICVVAVILVAGVWTKPKTLGNISRNVSELSSSTSMVSFTAEAGDKIKLSFSSEIEKGTLGITLCDSKGNVIKELEQAKELESIHVLDYDDTYILVAKYDDFAGKFKITAYDITEAGSIYQRCSTS